MDTNTKGFIKLEKKILELNSHELFKSCEKFSQQELKVFMEYHVFAVWDFMSIVKSLQNHICPSGSPWLPNEYTKNGIAHLINEIIFSEESDFDNKGNYYSHFDLYLLAMKDVGADTKKILKFINNFKNSGEVIYNASSQDYPKESIDFINNTFQCIKTNKIANIAGIFTYGRETTIPSMFKHILEKIDNDNILYKNLRLYINRHIEVDSSRHGPLSMQLFKYVCKNDQEIYDEAIEHALEAIKKRISLWDGVLKKISQL